MRLVMFMKDKQRVGFGRNPKVFMKAGDVVEVEVKEIGILRNPIKA
jgi:acylpyruvate hydrolase